MNEIEIEVDERTECQIHGCIDPVTAVEIHPQRGRMTVCHYHAKNIRRIPDGRFPAGGSTP